MKRPYWMLLGFLLFLTGILSLIFSMVGLKLTYINFIYGRGVLTLLIQITFMLGGLIILYMSRMQHDDDDE